MNFSFTHSGNLFKTTNNDLPSFFTYLITLLRGERGKHSICFPLFPRFYMNDLDLILTFNKFAKGKRLQGIEENKRMMINIRLEKEVTAIPTT